MNESMIALYLMQGILSTNVEYTTYERSLSEECHIKYPSNENHNDFFKTYNNSGYEFGFDGDANTAIFKIKRSY